MLDKRGRTRVICSCRSARNRVALTFDDGPSQPATLQIADILDDHHVQGTFFVVGRAVDARPDVARSLMARGHLLAGHSYSHSKLDAFVPGYPELERTQWTLRRHFGISATFYRPPFGLTTDFITGAAAREHVHLVNWDVNAGDWETEDSSIIARRVLKRARAGSIILLHDGHDGGPVCNRSATVAALPQILEGLAQRRLSPVRLDELLGVQPYLESALGDRFERQVTSVARA